LNHHEVLKRDAEDRDSALNLASEQFGVTIASLVARRGTWQVSDARMVVYWLLRSDGRTFEAVGDLLDRNHATVWHGVRVAERRLAFGGSAAVDMLALRERYRLGRDTVIERVIAVDESHVRAVLDELSEVERRLEAVRASVTALVEGRNG
jgi:hypothetical protein